MYTTELEETVFAMKQRVNQLEEDKQPQQILQLCKNLSSDSQLLKLRERTKVLQICSPLHYRVKSRLSLSKSTSMSQQLPTDSNTPPKVALLGKVMKPDILILPVVRELHLVPEDESTPAAPVPVTVKKQNTLWRSWRRMLDMMRLLKLSWPSLKANHVISVGQRKIGCYSYKTVRLEMSL